MDLPPWEKRRDKQTLWEDIKEGFNYVRNNRRILYIVGISYVVAVFGAPYNRFVPIFATNVLHVGPTGFGLLMAAPGLGATVAALSLATVKKLRVGVHAICYCVLGFSFSLVLFAFSHSFVLSLIFLSMVGFSQIAERALSNTAIQIATPPHLAGASSKLVLHGSRLVVPGQRDDRNGSGWDRHRLEFWRVRRCLCDRCIRFTVRHPQRPERLQPSLKHEAAIWLGLSDFRGSRLPRHKQTRREVR